MERIEEAFNDCIERMNEGETLQSCLSSYPDMADELESLLKVANTFEKAATDVSPRPEYKSEARYRFHAALAERDKNTVRKQPARWRLNLKWAAVALVLLVVFVIGGTTGIASADSVPGEPLYGVKTFIERVQMGLTFGAERRANLHVKFAERRGEEMQEMINRGNLEQANNLGIRLANQLTKAKLAAPVILESDDIVTRLEQLANKQVALLEIIHDKAPQGAQGSIQDLIESINTAYETAIEEIGEALPAVQILISGDVAATRDRITGTISISNNSDVNARIADVKYTLFYTTQSDGSMLNEARVIRSDTNTLGGLGKDVIIETNQTDDFQYSVSFSVPSTAVKIRGIISIKLVGRNLWYYDIAEFSMPSQ